MVQSGADLKQTHGPNENTRLHLAVEANSIDCLSFLLKSKGPVDLVNAHGESAIVCAVKKNNSGAVRLLLSNGAAVNQRFYVSCSTLLHEAAKAGFKQIVKLLVRAGADVNLRDTHGCSRKTRTVVEAGWTALYWAIDAGLTDIAELLIIAGSDVNTRDFNGKTPLHWAAFQRAHHCRPAAHRKPC